MTPTDAIVWCSALAAVVSVIFLFVLEAERVERRAVARQPTADRTALRRRAVLRQRLIGGAMFGGCALLDPTLLGHIAVAYPLALLIAVGATAAVIVPVVARASRAPAHLEHYPALPPPSSPTATWWAVNAGTWLFYLLGYEMFFRALLVLGLATFTPLWVAILVSTVFYVIVHLGKNAGEVAGSAVMGPVFALSAVASGSVLAPWLMHGLIALSNDVFAVRRRREATVSGATP